MNDKITYHHRGIASRTKINRRGPQRCWWLYSPMCEKQTRLQQLQVAICWFWTWLGMGKIEAFVFLCLFFFCSSWPIFQSFWHQVFLSLARVVRVCLSMWHTGSFWISLWSFMLRCLEVCQTVWTVAVYYLPILEMMHPVQRSCNFIKIASILSIITS